MRLTGGVAVLLAWAALQAPWLRCVSDCHDAIVLAVADHDHHEQGCDHHDGHGARSDHDHDRDGVVPPHHEDRHHHLEIRFEAPLPTKVKVAVAWLPALAAVTELPAPAHVATVVAPPDVAAPAPPLRTVVLLL
jgi:hypothetical protein